MKKVLLIILVAIAGIAWFAIQDQSPRYESNSYDFSFQYPDGYDIDEREVSEPSRHYSITLVRSSDLPAPENGEGPTSINISIYALNGFQTLEEWTRGNPASNFMLGPQTLSAATVDHYSAVMYEWDGLYRGKTTAFLYKGNIFLVSGTYMTPEDEIAIDYSQVVSSIDLE